MERRAFAFAWLSSALLLIVGVGCNADQQNGQDCLKDDDCESRHCVARICQAPGLPGNVDVGVVDSGSEAAADVSDAAADVSDAAEAPADVPVDTTPEAPPADTDVAEGG